MSSYKIHEYGGGKVHDNAHVESDAFVESDVFVESGAYVGSGAFVWSGAYVGRGAYVGSGAFVESGAVVESGASVAPNSVIHGDQRITQNTLAITGSKYVVTLSEHGIKIGCHPPRWPEDLVKLDLEALDEDPAFMENLEALCVLWHSFFEYVEEGDE